MYDFIISHGSYKWTPDVLIRSLVYEIPRCEPTELVEPNMRESFPVLQACNELSLMYHYLGRHGSLTSLKIIFKFLSERLMVRVLDFRRKFSEKLYFSKIQNRRFEIEKIKKI